MKSLKKSACICLVLLGFLCTLSGQGNREPLTSSAIERNVQNTGISAILVDLNTLYQYLNMNYLYDIDIEKVKENLTKALIASLDDPYSMYISEDDMEEETESLTGLYTGIGIYLTKMDPAFIDWDDESTYMVQVQSPFPGGPADIAGIRARDMISHVDGKPVAQMDADEVSELLRGEEGVPMTLVVHREDSVFEVTLTPEEVAVPSVSSTIIPGTGYGYISIATFTNSTYPLTSSALTDLSAQNMKALIIDLRNNGGGTTNSAYLVANFFLETGDTIVNIEKKDGSVIRMNASDQTRKYDLPVVVLVNEGTASASEILTGALKDNDRAVVIGETTFGKGVMQDVLPWDGGAIHFTSARYKTPGGNDINETGITPDITVTPPQMSDEELTDYYDFINEHYEDMVAWIDENPAYSTDNIEAFTDIWQDEISFDPYYLRLMIRNQYIVSMNWEDRPIADPVYDIVLAAAVDYLDSL